MSKVPPTKVVAPPPKVVAPPAKVVEKAKEKAPEPLVIKEHPDATYVKRDDIGLVIAKGLAVMYKTQPKNPVDFLAKWLLNYA